MGGRLWLGAAALLVSAVTAAFAADLPSELAPGGKLDSSTAHLAEGLMPPEILAYYSKGEFSSRIVDWPNGAYQLDEDFRRASEENLTRLDVDDSGLMIDKSTGQYPEHVSGHPFPKIDPADPKAATKIVWNVLYLIYSHLTSSRFDVNLAFLHRGGLDRLLRLKVFYNYFDGQKRRWLPKENPNGFLQQYIAAAESPQDVYGTTNLTWRFKGAKRDLLWAYVPALRRIRSVSPTNRSDGFLGSDITQDDGPYFDGKPTEFEWKLIGEGEVLRFADPYSLEGNVQRVPQPDGSVRTPISFEGHVFGAEDPSWKGVAWAPIAPVLAKRPVWIVEGTPKDRYYLFGKVELMVDKEHFQGVYNRKFSWQGELMQDFIPTGFLTQEHRSADGDRSTMWSAQVTYFSGINFKADRATNVNFGEKGNSMDQLVPYPKNFFDYQALYRFGK